MTRNRATSGGSGRLVLAAFLAVALVLPIWPVGTSYVAADDDLSARFENAIRGIGASIYSSEYRPANEGLGDTPTENWYFEVNYKGDGATVIVERAQSESLAGRGDAAITGQAGGSTVDMNGVTAHMESQSAMSAGQMNTRTSLWWQRGRYVVLISMFPHPNAEQVRELGRAVDGVIGGGSSGGGSDSDGGQEEEPPPEEPALAVSPSPSFFAEIGDTAVIRVSLAGVEADGKWATISGHGQDHQASFGGGGQAEFRVTHDDEQTTEYRFTIEAEGMRREVAIPVSAITVEPEPNPVTQEPYAGVIADGRTAMEIRVDIGTAAGTLQVAQPDAGRLEGDALSANGGVTLSGGKATLRYVPPAYLADNLSMQSAAPTLESDNGIANGRASGAAYSGSGAPMVLSVPLAFTFTDDSGTPQEISFDLAVSRTPIMLVHGFTGDRTTWAALQRHLAGKGFDGIIDEYYKGDQDIHDQSRALGQNIERELYRYEAFGLKGSRVDIVGHSMGGLIARNYSYGLEPHPTDVRKIIMVGTPNHGASFFDKLLGNLASEWFAKHKLASQQLYSGSAFLKQLNSGESVGRHLHPDIQYGNIYGELTDYVVPNTSAFLNGVTSRRLRGVTHSTAIPFPGVPITDSGTVFGWIEDWLGEDIPRAALRSTKVQVVKGQGEIFLSGIDISTGQETREDLSVYPKDVAAWEEVGTGPDGSARIRLSVAGLAWGTIDLAPDSQIALGNVTPGAVTVRVRRGQARFRSLKREGGGHFQVTIGEQPPGEWYTFSPDAKVIGLDTDFVVSADGAGAAEVLVLEGEAQVVRDDASWDSAPVIGENAAAIIGGSAGSESAIAADQWWTEGFYRPGLVEVVQEWYAIVRAQVEEWLSDATPETSEVAE